MLLERASGILLHPTSLPNGVLDEHAFAFVDWLAAAGQSWWQVLPLGPPEGLTGSPYMSPSAFAGSPGILADPRCARVGGRGRRLPRPTRLLARRLGRLRRERRRSGPVRARVADAAGVRRASAACASSATCRSTSRRTAPTTAPTRACSRRARSRACRPTSSRRRASCGATRSTTGRRCTPTVTGGGSSGSAARSSSST